MSTISMEEKIELVKGILRQIHEGVNVEELKSRYGEVLRQISPGEIPLIEQQLVREGVAMEEIMKLCDLHVALFREFLISRELMDIPKGHPLYLLIEENNVILRHAEALNMYLVAIAGEADTLKLEEFYGRSLQTAESLYRSLRLHYQKVQMTIFPYLERVGIFAIPRVLWSREHEAIVKLRKLREAIRSREPAEPLLEIGGDAVKEVSEVVFRENRILFPTLWALFSEGMWRAVYDEAREIGWAVEDKYGWTSNADPVYPWQLQGGIDPELIGKLPREVGAVALYAQGGLKPDTFKLAREGDLNLATGFLSREELEQIMAHLPIEVTFADSEGRVRFYSKGGFGNGFARVKTLLGRRLEYCHPPQLEQTIMKVFEDLRNGARNSFEFYSTVGGRIVRVLVVSVRNADGKFLGALEVVEDVTQFVKDPEEVKRKVVIL